jgi:hypothetical protein
VHPREALEVVGEGSLADAGRRLGPGVDDFEAGVAHEARQERADVGVGRVRHPERDAVDAARGRDGLLREEDASRLEGAGHPDDDRRGVVDVEEEEPAEDEPDRLGQEEVLCGLGQRHDLGLAGCRRGLGDRVPGGGVVIDGVDAPRAPGEAREGHAHVARARPDIGAPPPLADPEPFQRRGERPAVDIIAELEERHRPDATRPSARSVPRPGSPLRPPPRAACTSPLERAAVRYGGAVDATLLLCDAAQVAEGKLYILGGGWSITGPDPLPSAVAMKVQVEWSEADVEHHWELYLVDEDGHPVTVPTSNGPVPLEVRGDFRLVRPDNLPEGVPLDLPLAVNFGPLPLEPGRRYTWCLTIDGESRPNWVLGFTTRPAPPSD